MPGEPQHYLNHLSALRQDASSPGAATVRSLDDLLEHFPSLAPKDDSPILGRRPSLSPDDGVAAAGSSENDLAALSQSIYDAPSSFYSAYPASDRPRAPTPTSTRAPPPMAAAPDSSTIHRTYSALEIGAQRTRQTPANIATGVDANANNSAETRSRAFSTSLIPPTPPYASRTGSQKGNLSLYATPQFVTAGETVSTPPLPDLPDPNTYPDPYPNYHRAPSRHNGMTPPISLFSEGSSSASTRSSLAYNSVYLRSNEGHDGALPDDFLHRRGTIASHYTADTSFGSHEGDMSLGDLEPGDVGVATTSDEVVHLTHSSSTASFASGSRTRTVHPVSESVRWSDSSYGGRGMSMSEVNLRAQPSAEWDNIVEEREDTTTDDEASLFIDDDDDDDGNDADNDRTAAVLVAEEGLGDIVRGEGLPVDRIVVRTGSTHMLLSGSTTPNRMPGFLSMHLTGLANTLLALDISCNMLPALPPALAACHVLEELNISANPLRVLPAWLSQLTSLRLFIADSIGITNIPQSLHTLTTLHTLSIRKNRLYSLPAWLCRLTALETLYVDGNPFLEPWSSLIAPILDGFDRPVPAYPPYTPPTAALPPSSAAQSTPDTNIDTPQSGTSFPLSPGPEAEPSESPLRRSFSSPQSRRPNVDSTYSQANAAASRPPSSAVPASYQPTSPRSRSGSAAAPPPPGVLASRTPSTFSSPRAPPPPPPPPLPSSPVAAPAVVNKSALVGSFLSALDSTLPDAPPPREKNNSKTSSTGSLSRNKPVRRMKSADELSRMNTSSASTSRQQAASTTGTGGGYADEQLPGRRFESLPRGAAPPSNVVGSRTGERSRVPLTVFADASAGAGREPPNPRNVPIPDSRPASIVSRPASRAIQLDDPGAISPTEGDGKEGKRTWGFLKKMSMGRMRSTSSPRDHHHFAVPGSAPGVPPVPGSRGGMVRAHTTAGRTTSPLPQLSPMPSPSPSLGANGHGHHGLGRPDAMMHANSAPAVPRIGEDGILLPPVNIGAPLAPAFASQTSLPTITAPVMEEEEDEHEQGAGGQEAPPLPAKSQLQHKLSREALATISTSLQLPGQSQGPSRTPSPNLSAQLLTPLSTRAQRRRSFLPLASASSSSSGYFEIPVPSPGPFSRDPMPTPSDAGVSDIRDRDEIVPDSSHSTSQPQYIVAPPTSDTSAHHQLDEERENEARARADAYKRGLRTIMAYLRDLSDLSGALGASVASNGADGASTPGSPSTADQTKRRRPTVNGGGSSTVERVFSDGGSSQHGSTGSPGLHKKASMISLAGPAMSVSTNESSGSAGVEDRKYKEDKNKRTFIIKEIVRTERTYVKQLQELVELYVLPSAGPVSGTFSSNSKETVIPLAERRIVFNGLESLYKFHRETLLPSFERAMEPLKEADDDGLGDVSASVASQLAMAFVSHAAFMKMYTTYINNFDNCVARTQNWAHKPAVQPGTTTPGAGAASVIGMGLSMSVVAGVAPEPTGNVAPLTSSQRKRIKQFLKKQKTDPRHSQINLEGYLLLPVQRVPRYKLMLEDLVKSTPPKSTAFEDPLEVALNIISALASGMNEGKRETESRQKLLHWQKRIRGKFPSPLVQPHRRLVMDGRLLLSRVVRKSQTFAEIYKGDGEKTLVQVDCLTPEVTPRPLVGLLCNDLLVLCKDPSQGENPHTTYDLWAVLRMQTVPQPASVVHGNTLRVVDNKAVLYFEAASTSEALTWTRAINMHIPASR